KDFHYLPLFSLEPHSTFLSIFFGDNRHHLLVAAASLSLSPFPSLPFFSVSFFSLSDQQSSRTTGDWRSDQRMAQLLQPQAPPASPDKQQRQQPDSNRRQQVTGEEHQQLARSSETVTPTRSA
ncbi:hypothetical protein AABB24_002665, partial [Solanum stoloniferum]